MSSAISAMQAFRGVIDSKANNIANARTDGYKAETTELREGEDGGVELVRGRDESPGPPLPPTSDDDIAAAEAAAGSEFDPGRIREGSNVDIASELIEMREAELALKANANVLRRGMETVGSFIDEFA